MGAEDLDEVILGGGSTRILHPPWQSWCGDGGSARNRIT